jgi:Skp family chaperone for outer membrane proteins
MPRTALLRVLVVFCMLLVAPSTALAEFKVAVVDFQTALTQIDEGATAMARLEGVRDEKMRNIEGKRQQLTAMQAELRNQASILSEAALAAKEEAFMQAQMEYQQAAMQAEQELQNQYLVMMEEFFTKLSAVAEEIGTERSYNLVLEATESGVVFNQGVDDITDELVKRYNARHNK